MNQMVPIRAQELVNMHDYLVAAHKARQARYAAVAIKPAKPEPAKISYEEQAIKDMEYLIEEDRKRRWEAAIAEAAKQAAKVFAEALSEVPFPSIRSIIKIVADAYEVTPADIISHRRSKKVMIPRHVAIYLCRICTPLSLPQIGRSVGKRDHTTIWASVHGIEERMSTDSDLRAKIEELRIAVLAERGGA